VKAASNEQVHEEDETDAGTSDSCSLCSNDGALEAGQRSDGVLRPRLQANTSEHETKMRSGCHSSRGPRNTANRNAQTSSYNKQGNQYKCRNQARNATPLNGERRGKIRLRDKGK
jgi:hypothetical protein